MGEEAKVRYLQPEEYLLWDTFVDESPQGSIFCKSWWLKSVSKDFKILAYIENNEITGGIALPIQYKGFYRAPRLTPSLGILFKDFSRMKHVNRLSKEMNITRMLVDNLPKAKQFSCGFNYNFKNALPFQWKKYNVTVGYTYVLDDLTNLDRIYEGFKSELKGQIRKAVKSGLQVVDNLPLHELYMINKKTFDRQKLPMPYSESFISSLDLTLKEKDSRKMFFAVDKSGKLHAAIYIVYNSKSAYYIIGGEDPELRSSAAISLLMWEAIKFASTVSKRFDFEGSSIENIEKYFRSFGGQLKTYYKISKSSLLIKLLSPIARWQKNLLRRLGII